MILTNITLLNDFAQKHSNSVNSINNWVDKVISRKWHNHTELKSDFPSADYVGNSRYVFNIGGNKFRIIVVVIFISEVMDIRFIGTHAEYDKIDSTTI